MSKAVSKQSLDALANLAFSELKLRAEGDMRTEAANNLDGSSGSALFRFLLGAPDAGKTTSEELWSFANAFTTGAEFGIAVAAAILTHEHDLPALCKAIKSELRDSSNGWPEQFRMIPKAA